jgi:hypothetical protein
MSWVFGCYSNNIISDDDKIRFGKIHKQCLHKYDDKNMYIAGGGISETCIFLNKGNGKGYLVLGLGLESQNGRTRSMSKDDWSRLIENKTILVDKLNGHFVIIRWDAGITECFTDQLGLRTIYISKTKTGTIFSTRLDWVAKAKKECKLNEGAFGSHWLGYNQISTKSLVNDIERTGQSGYVKIRPEGFTIKDTPWTPIFENHNGKDLEKELNKILALGNGNYSLGLSGGLDSRVLFSLLTNSADRDISVHVFGSSSDPDVSISRQMSEKLNVSYTNYDFPTPSLQESIDLIKDYPAQVSFIGPASTSLNIRYYRDLQKRGKIMIDGGFGEIARRQYLNRLSIQGRKYVLQPDASRMLAYMNTHRADIFTKDFNNAMQKGYIHELDDYLKRMPNIKQIGLDNYLDLLAVRSRLPNYFGFEQARLDQEVVNFMPFAQPSVLNVLFNIPVSKRKNRGLFKDIIRKNKNALNRYDLVGGNNTYPFWLNTVGAQLWMRRKPFAKRKHYRNNNEGMFNVIKEFVLDIVNSRQVKEFSLYDYQKVKMITKDYYSGKKNKASELDWWLSFEMWRQAVGLD